MRLSPSLLSADFSMVGKQLDELLDNGVEELHFDVMDGDFVPALSFGNPVLKTIDEHFPTLFMDAHLMVTEPWRFIDDFKKAGADNITVHVEACKHIDRTIEAIKAEGLEAGVALNPGTPLSSISEIVHKVDRVLLMSVNPGFGGQKYIPYCTDKVARLKKMRENLGLNFAIQIDGGISPANVKEVVDAGVDNVVAGSAIFKGNITENCKAFKEALK